MWRTLFPKLSLAAVLAMAPFKAWAQEEFDCSPDFESIVFGPGENAFGTIMAEDRWPSRGDLDFNDLVLAYNVVQRLDLNGDTSSLRLTLQPLAAGGAIHNGVALRIPGTGALPLKRAQVKINGVVTDAQIVDGRTIVITNDLRAGFEGTSEDKAGPVNAIKDGKVLRSKNVVLEVSFTTPITIPAEDAPGDLFFFYTDDPSHEIHRPQYRGTPRMNQALFGTADDGSVLGDAEGRRFVDDQGLPFLIVLPEPLATWPTEGVEVQNLFPEILTFASSNGENSRDFYKRPAPNVAFKYEQPIDLGSDAWTGMRVDGNLRAGRSAYHFTPTLPAGHYSFELHSNGDASLYVRVGQAPTFEQYDCKPGAPETLRRCQLTLTEPANVYFQVTNAWNARTDYQLYAFDNSLPPLGARMEEFPTPLICISDPFDPPAGDPPDDPEDLPPNDGWDPPGKHPRTPPEDNPNETPEEEALPVAFHSITSHMSTLPGYPHRMLVTDPYAGTVIQVRQNSATEVVMTKFADLLPQPMAITVGPDPRVPEASDQLILWPVLIGTGTGQILSIDPLSKHVTTVASGLPGNVEAFAERAFACYDPGSATKKSGRCLYVIVNNQIWKIDTTKRTKSAFATFDRNLNLKGIAPSSWNGIPAFTVTDGERAFTLPVTHAAGASDAGAAYNVSSLSNTTGLATVLGNSNEHAGVWGVVPWDQQIKGPSGVLATENMHVRATHYHGRANYLYSVGDGVYETALETGVTRRIWPENLLCNVTSGNLGRGNSNFECGTANDANAWRSGPMAIGGYLTTEVKSGDQFSWSFDLTNAPVDADGNRSVMFRAVAGMGGWGEGFDTWIAGASGNYTITYLYADGQEISAHEVSATNELFPDWGNYNRIETGRDEMYFIKITAGPGQPLSNTFRLSAWYTT